MGVGVERVIHLLELLLELHQGLVAIQKQHRALLHRDVLAPHNKGSTSCNVLGKSPSRHRLTVAASAVDQHHRRVRQDVGDQKLSAGVELGQFLDRHQPFSTFVLDLIDDELFQSDLVPITSLQSQVVQVEVHLRRVVQLQVGLRLFDDFFKGKGRQLVRDRRLVDLVDRLFNRRVLAKSFAVWVVVVRQLDQAADA